MKLASHRRLAWSVPLLLGCLACLGWLGMGCGQPPVPFVGPNPDGAVTVPPTFEPLALGDGVSGNASSTNPAGYELQIPAGDQYALVLENVSLDLTATVYTHSDRTGAVGACTAEFFSQACLFTLAPGPVFVELTSAPFSSSFRMTLVRIVDEGTEAVPVSLSGGTFADIHTVAPSGTSYWSFQATASGGHAIDVNTIEVVPDPGATYLLEWFATTDFTGTPLRSCTHDTSACMRDDMAPGTYGVRMTNTGTRPLVLHARGVHTLSEGAWATPVPLTLGVQHDGGFDGGLRSFYTLTTAAHSGGYVFDFPGLVSAYYEVFIYASANAATPVSGCITRDLCVLDDLEANTTYFAVITGSYTLDYGLVVRAGLSEGTQQTRVPLALGVEHVGAVDDEGTSRYSFTPATSGYYELIFPPTIDFFGDLDVTIVDPDDAYTIPDDCFFAPCRLGALEAGVTYGFDVHSVGFAGSLPLTVVRDPVGDGTTRSPYPLVLGQDRVAPDINAYYGNHYRVNTSGAPGPIAIVAYSTGGFWLSTATDDFPIECSGNARMQTCIFDGPFPGGILDLHVQRSGSPPDFRIHVFNAAPTAGCEADATSCFTFEGAGTTMPAAITEPATSGRAWAVTTGSANLGVYGIAAGTNATSSCFQLTTPLGAAFAAFDLDYLPAGALDSFDIAVDGMGVAWGSSATAGYARRAVAFSPAASHVLSFCLRMSGNGTRHAYVDDLELH